MEKRNRAGVIAMTFSVALGTFSDVIMRVTSTSVPTSQILVVRGVLISVLLGAICGVTLSVSAFKLFGSRLILLRAMADGLMTFLFYLSLPMLPFSNLMAIILSAPIFAYAISMLAYRDRISAVKWTFMLAGFVGVAIVVRPSTAGSIAGTSLALGAALAIAVRDHITREINSSIPSFAVSLLSSISVLAFGLIYLLFDRDWVVMSAGDWRNLLTSIVLVSAGNVFGVMAFRASDIALVAPIRFATLPMAMALGYLMLDEIPDVFGIIGGAVICACSLSLAIQFRDRAGS